MVAPAPLSSPQILSSPQAWSLERHFVLRPCLNLEQCCGLHLTIMLGARHFVVTHRNGTDAGCLEPLLRSDTWHSHVVSRIVLCSAQVTRAGGVARLLRLVSTPENGGRVPPETGGSSTTASEREHQAAMATAARPGRGHSRHAAALAASLLFEAAQEAGCKAAVAEAGTVPALTRVLRDPAHAAAGVLCCAVVGFLCAQGSLLTGGSY
jgi:hypothetical protein